MLRFMGQSPANSKRERGGEGVTSHSDFRNQSAMEYLMTYGWAILIVAVILGALWSLGIFSAATFTPKVPPGSCRVFRPGGYASTQNIALTGECSGVLPQFVAQFNGKSSWISDNSISSLLPSGGAARTLTFWFQPSAVPGNTVLVATDAGYSLFDYGCVSALQPGCSDAGVGRYFAIRATPTEFRLDTETCGAPSNPYAFNTAWQFGAVVITQDSNTIKFYHNGNADGAPTLICQISTVAGLGATIGAGRWGYYNGSIANVQIYNTSLSSDQVQYLYQRGIGGAPIALRNIVGWWPLNGDANDYSGLNNNGAPANIIFNGT